MHAVIQLTAKAKLNLNKTSLSTGLYVFIRLFISPSSLLLTLALFLCSPKLRLGNEMSRHVQHRKTYNINEVVLYAISLFHVVINIT